MTNSDIMRASLLDIVFENRNKDYGAYELRHGYTKRMFLALGAGVAIIGLLVAVVALKGERSGSVKDEKKEGLVIREYVLPPDKPKEPEKPKVPEKQKVVAKVKPATTVPNKIAEIKFTTPEIKEVVKTPMPPADDLEGKLISDKNKTGEPDKGAVVTVSPIQTTGNGNAGNGGPSEPVQEFVIQEREPEFPGGQAALQKFLARYLTTPEELSSGEKKVVKVRFKVEKDGSVNAVEILASGGNTFDNEVLRVVKRMPKWIPAIQNGINVPVSYVLPVTFIGLEG